MDVYELDAHLQEMTPHKLKILQALYDADGHWMTRSKVARSLGKKRLTPYDIDCLNMLTDKGIILTSTQPTSAPGSDFAYIYSMPDDVAHIVQEWSEIRESVRSQEEIQRRKPVNLVDE